MPTPTELRDQLKTHQELFLANALMLGEHPSPSGAEKDRIDFLAERFSSLQEVSILSLIHI